MDTNNQQLTAWFPPKLGRVHRPPLSSGTIVGRMPKLLSPVELASKKFPLDLSNDQRAIRFNDQAGKGPYSFADGSYYKGNVLNGKRHGVGTEILSDGSFYNGLWDNDRYNAIGQKIWPNGYCYHGEWSSDVKSGRGKLYSPAKLVCQGNWAKDEFL